MSWIDWRDCWPVRVGNVLLGLIAVVFLMPYVLWLRFKYGDPRNFEQHLIDFERRGDDNRGKSP